MNNFTYFKRINFLQCFCFSNFLCLILHSLTLLVLRSFKEEIPILVLTQVGDSDEDEPCSPPPIGFSPVWFLYAYFYCCLLYYMTICTEPTLASINYFISGETDHHPSSDKLKDSDIIGHRYITLWTTEILELTYIYIYMRF